MRYECREEKGPKLENKFLLFLICLPKGLLKFYFIRYSEDAYNTRHTPKTYKLKQKTQKILKIKLNSVSRMCDQESTEVESQSDNQKSKR